MHSSRAEAHTDTVCVEITRRNFKYLQQRFPSIMVRMLESESSKGRNVLDHLRSIRLDPVMLRVVRALLGLAKSAGTTVLTDLGHQDIADPSAPTAKRSPTCCTTSPTKASSRAGGCR